MNIGRKWIAPANRSICCASEEHFHSIRKNFFPEVQADDWREEKLTRQQAEDLPIPSVTPADF